MAKKKTGTLKSKAAKLNKLNNKVKDSEETYGGRMDLPGGLKGIAQFSGGKLDEYKSGPNQGELYIRFEGVIVQSNKVEGVDYVGQYTSLMSPLHEQTLQSGEVRSLEENYDRALGKLRSIGYNTEDLEDIEEFIAECVEEANYFSFSTTNRYAMTDKKKETPTGCWENWHKQIEDFVPEDEDDVEEEDEEVEDEEEEELDEELEEEEEESEDEDEEEEEESEEDEEEEEDEDEDEEEEEEEEYEVEEPEKGESYFYKPPRKRKKILLDVVTVSKKLETVTLQDEDGKKYSKVPWSDLSTSEG